MKVKTNLRAGAGGSGGGAAGGQKRNSSATQPIALVYNFVLNSTRCVGI
jgi:hypothetical protein